MAFGASTVGFSNLPSIGSKNQLKTTMIQLKIESKEFFNGFTARNMFKIDRGLAEVVGQEMLETSILYNLAGDHYKTLINVSSTKEQHFVGTAEVL